MSAVHTYNFLFFYTVIAVLICFSCYLQALFLMTLKAFSLQYYH